MNISEPFIRRPIMTVLLTVALVLVGLEAFRKLPVSDLPDVDYPVIVVKVRFPGASPETMANTVASPLEREFMKISGMQELTSSSVMGETNIYLQFEIAKNIDSAAVDVQAAIMRAKEYLPPDLPHDPSYLTVNPALVPILYFLLSSDTMPLSDLYTYANTFIGQRLATIEGVSNVEVHAFPYAVRVQVNPERLSELGVTLEDVAQTIQRGSTRHPVGNLDGTTFSPIITTNGQLTKAALYDPLIITYKDQMPLRIQDVGKAIDSLSRYRYSQRYIHKDKNVATIVITLQRRPGGNTVAISKAINEFLPVLKAELPGSVEFITLFDRADLIKLSLEEAEWTLFFAFLLVALVIFRYLGKPSSAIIPILIMPLSLLGTFPIMYLLNYTVDNLSLLAFILAMGFIVDDAIVVLENVVRRVELGEDPWNATIKGAQQIGFTILSMTISLVAVFIPLVFMGGLVGRIFREFAVTLSVITLVSGLISLTVTPLLCSFFIKKAPSDHGERRVLSKAESVNTRLLNIYKPCLQWALGHKILMLLATLVMVVFSLYFFATLPKDFLPNDDIGFLIAYTTGEEGISADRMIEHQKKVDSIILADPNVERFISIAAFPQNREGVLYIKLKPRKERAALPQIMQNLYEKLNLIPGINTHLKNIPSIDVTLGVESKGSYQYALHSIETPILYPTTDKMIAKMYTLPGFQGISSDLNIRAPHLHIEILRDEAAALGISAEAIERALQLAYSGGKVSSFETAINQYEVILELEPRFQQQASSLASIYVRSDTTQELVPLNAVARWEERLGPATIQHIAQLPATTISFSLLPGIPAPQALALLEKAAAEVLPPGVRGSVTGTAQALEESTKSMPFLFGVALLTIYIVLGILYESFIHPLTIISTLPSATFGGLATLALLGEPISLYAALGLFMLIGIVKKNGIMIVDYALEYERLSNKSPQEAIFDACMVRFRPILMTTMAAIMGAVPIVLGTGIGAEARRPLGWVVIGGLMFSQLITLFATPVFYLYMAKWNKSLTLSRQPPPKAS